MYLMHFNPNHDPKTGRFTFTTFISGSSKTQNPDSPYYRKELPKEVTSKIDSYMDSGDKIIVGDAPGIDTQVQDYLNSKGYENVEVYGPGDKVRYLANSKWNTKTVDSGKYEPNTDEWRAEKDKVMSKIADRGLAIVLENGGAGATRDNINRLVTQNKDVSVFELDSKGGIKQISAENSMRSKVGNYLKTMNSLSDEEYRLFTDGATSKSDEKQIVKDYSKWLKDNPDTSVFISKYGNVTMASLENAEWNIGWATNPKSRGTGVTQSNIKEAISLIRNVSDLTISAIIETGNIASQKTAEKAGFTNAGNINWDDGSIRKKYVYNN